MKYALNGFSVGSISAGRVVHEDVMRIQHFRDIVTEKQKIAIKIIIFNLKTPSAPGSSSTSTEHRHTTA